MMAATSRLPHDKAIASWCASEGAGPSPVTAVVSVTVGGLVHASRYSDDDEAHWECCAPRHGLELSVVFTNGEFTACNVGTVGNPL